jgi:hypothetical protein
VTKLLLDPCEEGFKVSFPAEARAQQLKGGPSRYRRDLLGARVIVECQWVTDKRGWIYLEAFHRSVAQGGRVPFEISLAVASSARIDHTARFVPGSFRLDGIKGPTYLASAALEVVVPEDPAADAALVAAFVYYDDAIGETMVSLGELVTETMPGTLL